MVAERVEVPEIIVQRESQENQRPGRVVPLGT